MFDKNVNAWLTLKSNTLYGKKCLFKMSPSLTLNQFYTMVDMTYLTRICFQESLKMGF